MRKKKRKKKKFLTNDEKKAFAQAIINGKMVKQVIAEFDISVIYGYKIFNELLEWKAEWKMIKYFVWEPSLLGPMPRIWHGKQTDGNGKDQGTIGKPVALADDDERSIDQLAKDYPCVNS